jgi:2-keto-3-deoxy-L-rhamnonate aldolase RhmA
VVTSVPPLKNRLGELLDEHDALFGVICRDPTLTEIELMAQAGFHIVWFDMEHGPQSMAEVLGLARMVTHLGMVPLVRMPELSRTQVQRLLDGGIQVLALPDIRSADEAARFVELGKYPPLGSRGVSSSSAGTDYTMGADPEQRLREANDATHLMLMIENDEAYESLGEILAVDGIDMVTVGPMDWSVSLGLFGDEARTRQTPKIERVFTEAVAAGKIASAGAFSIDQAAHFHALGVRVFFVGVDILIKRQSLVDTLTQFQNALGAP